jgi:hypothetical protein
MRLSGHCECIVKESHYLLGCPILVAIPQDLQQRNLISINSFGKPAITAQSSQDPWIDVATDNKDYL